MSFWSAVGKFFLDVGTAVIEYAKNNPVSFGLQSATLIVGVKGFMQAKQMMAKGQDILANKTSAGGKLPVIYGTRRVGAQIVYMDVSANDSRDLYVVYALSVGECDEIIGRTIELDGNPLTDSARFRDGGYIGSDKISSGSGSLNTVSQNGTGINAGAGQFGSSPTSKYRYVMNLHHGQATQLADPMLVASMPNWTSAHKLNGVAYIAAHYGYDKEGIWSGIPQLTVQVRGKKVYDPRDTNQTFGTVSTYKYSDNPALTFLDYITNNEYGKGLTQSQINMSTFTAAANVCDTKVDQPYFNGTAQSLTWSGNVGDDFITIGGTDPNTNWWQNKIGEVIDIRDGSNTLVVDSKEIKDVQRNGFYDQNNEYIVYINDTLGSTYSSQAGTSLVKVKRFHCNGYLDANKNVMDNAKELLANMRGIFLYIDGKYELSIEDTGTATFNITDDHIISDTGISVNYGKKDKKANKVIVEFYNANKKYELDTATVLHDATPEYYSDDGDEILEIKAEFPYISDPYIAYNMGKAILTRSRKQMTIQFLGTPEMYKLNVGDIVTLSYAGTFDTVQTCRVEALELEPNGLVAVSLIEYFDVYTWETPPEEPLEELANLPSAYAVKAPTGLSFTDSSSSSTGRPILSWDAPTDYPDYEFRVNVVDDSGNQLMNRIVNTTFAELNFTPTGINYVASVTSLNTLGTESDAETETFSVSDEPVGLGDIRADAVTANTIDVNELSAITANLGAIDAGSIDIGSGNFTVSTAGLMTATDATISGGITATSLNVTNATITGTLDASVITLNSEPLDSVLTYSESGGIGLLTLNEGAAIDGDFVVAGNFEATGTQPDLIVGKVTGISSDTVQADAILRSSTGSGGFRIQAGSGNTQVVGLVYDAVGGTTLSADGGASGTFKINADGALAVTFDSSQNATFTGEVTADALGLPSQTPSTTTNKLYNVGGSLYFNGSQLGTGSGDITSVAAGDNLNGGGTSGAVTLNLNSTISGDHTFSNNVVIGGNLDVQGTTTTIDTTNLDVKDKNITLNYGTGDTSANANGAGITIQDAVNSTTDATLTWNTSNDSFNFSHPVNVTGNLKTTGNLDVDGIIDNTRNNGNVSAPNTSDHTAGTRINFYDASATSWYAMGIENSTLWFNTDSKYKWYADAAIRMTLDGANLTVTGNVTATAFYGDGSNLTGVSSTTINNNADNRIITGSGTANTLNAESGLTYNGSTLAVTGTISASGAITSSGLTVDYTGDRTGDAGILVTNDASDWGIKVDKDGTADYGILSQTDGENAVVVRNAAGVNKIQLQGDGDATFAGTINSGAITSSGNISGATIEGYTFPSFPSVSGYLLQSDTSGNLQWTANAISSYTNSQDDRVITSTGSTGVNAETNLTYNVTDGLKITDSLPKLSLIGTTSSASEIVLDSSVQGFINFKHGSTTDASIGYEGVFNNKLVLSSATIRLSGAVETSSTLSTGAISSGTITASDTSGSYGTAINLTAGDTLSAGQGAKQIVMAFGSSSTVDYPHSIRTRHNSNAATGNNIEFWLWNQGTDSSSTVGTQRALVLESSTGLDLLTGGYKVGGQEVITSGRNLTNIGTISSGAITSSGNIALTSNSNHIATRNILARDTNGLTLGTTNATAAINIDNSGNVSMPLNLTVTGTISSGAITSTGNSMFTGSGSTGDAFKVNRGSNGDAALRVLNTGEVVIDSNYLYVTAAAGAYFSNSARFRGGITNDTGDLTLADDVVVTGTISSGGITSTGNSTFSGVIGVGGTSTNSNFGVYLQNNKWYATQYSPSHDVVRINANTTGGLDIYNQTDSGFANVKAGSYNIGSTTVIDGSRNITAGTISSGAINTTSNVTLGTFSTTNTGTLILTGSTANKKAELKCTNGNLHIDSEAGNATYINYYEGTGGVFFGTGAGGHQAHINSAGGINLRGSGAAPTNSAIAVNGTSILDNSRNLTSIGTISSGAITSTGDISGSTIEGYVFPSYPSQSGGVLTSNVSGNMAWSFNTVSSYVDSGDDRIITSTGSTGIRGESNLTYNETDGLKITDSLPKLSLIPTSSSATQIILDSSVQGFIDFKHGATTDASIGYEGVFNNKLSISCGNGVTFGSSPLTTTGTISSGAITSTGILSVGSYFKAGTSVAQGFYQDSVNGAYRANGTTSTRGFWFQTPSGASTTMYVGLVGTYAGRVGVGTTTPSEQFHATGVARVGSLKIDGTTVIDGSRNLTNIGTISSGAITSTGALTLSADTTDCLNFSSNTTSDYRGISFNGRSALTADYNDGYLRLNNGNEFSNGVYTLGNIRADGYVQTGAIRINTTTIIDGSRNFSNIGTISSGAITSTGNLLVNGITAINKTAVASAVALTINSDASTTSSYGLEVCNATSNTRLLVDGVGNTSFYGSNNAITARFTSDNLFQIGGTTVINASREIQSVTFNHNLYTDEYGKSLVGNFGQFQAHSAYSGGFNLSVAMWGWNYVQGNTNAPNTNSNQWYRNRVSLGDQYGYNYDSNDYWLEMAYPRYTHSSAGHMWMRSCEGGTVGGWSQVGSNIIGNFVATGNVTAYSDKRLKTNIETLDSKKALQMRGVSFIKDGVEGSGVIAQEIEEIAPELVLTADDEMGTKSVAYGNLVGYLIETVKDQQKQIDELKQRLDNDS